MTPIFVDSLETSQYFEGRGYGLMTSPMLNPGQTVTCEVDASGDNSSPVEVALSFGVFDEQDEVVYHRQQEKTLGPKRVHHNRVYGSGLWRLSN